MSGPKHGPIEAKHHALMNAVAAGLDDVFNGPAPKALPGLAAPERERSTGFLLCVFDFSEQPKEGRFNYISNADKLDVHAALKEISARLEGRLASEQPSKRN